MNGVRQITGGHELIEAETGGQMLFPALRIDSCHGQPVANDVEDRLVEDSPWDVPCSDVDHVTVSSSADRPNGTPSGIGH